MRNTYLLVLLLGLALPFAARAQQPFERFGVKVKVLTLSNGRYPEFFANDSLRRIGSVVYNTRLKRIAYLLPVDSLAGRAPSEVTSRWLAVDPLAEKYAFITPYAYTLNNPIKYIDPDGREVWIAYEANDQARRVKYEGGKLYNEDGSAYKGNNTYVKQVSTQLNQLREGNDKLAKRLSSLESSELTHTVMMIPEGKLAKGEKNNTFSTDPEAAEKGERTGSRVEYNPNDRRTHAGDDRDPRDGLAHELLGHSPQYDQGRANNKEKTKTGVPVVENEAVNVENEARKVTGDRPRETFGGRKVQKQTIE